MALKSMHRRDGSDRASFIKNEASALKKIIQIQDRLKYYGSIKHGSGIKKGSTTAGCLGAVSFIILDFVAAPL